MPIEFRCPSCGKLLKTADDKAGRQARCPDCASELTVPSGASSPPPVPGAGMDSRGDTICPACGEPNEAGRDQCAVCGEPFFADGGASDDGRIGIELLQPTKVEFNDVWTRGWQVFKDRLGLCLGGFWVMQLLAIAASVPGSILGAVMDNGGPRRDPELILVLVYFVFQVASWLAQMFLQAGLVIFFLKLVRGEQAEIGDLFRGGPYLLRVIGNSLLFGLMIVLGFLACVIPAIILALMFWPFMLVLIDTDARGVDCFSGAKRITEGNWGTALLMYLVSIGISLLGILAFCVGIIFAAPLVQVLQVVMYCLISGRPRSRATM